MEVWVEIPLMNCINSGSDVTSCVEVWVEIGSAALRSPYCSVTSCVEVWVEIPLELTPPFPNAIVTSCVEVWVEIWMPWQPPGLPLSPSAWRCGLKLCNTKCNTKSSWSPPAWRCGLKLIYGRRINRPHIGHLLRGGVG